MEVRFEIFKSFIRVDLQLQLEVEVAYTKENPSCLSIFLGRPPPPPKKRQACAVPGTAPGRDIIMVGMVS